MVLSLSVRGVARPCMHCMGSIQAYDGASWLRDPAIYKNAIGLNLELGLPSANPHLHLSQTVSSTVAVAFVQLHLQRLSLLVEAVPQGRLIAENRHNQHF